MARAETVFMICPQGHSFITLQSFGYTFTCPECDLSFDASPSIRRREKEGAHLGPRADGAPPARQLR